jgi:Glycosyltransferase family 87
VPCLMAAGALGLWLTGRARLRGASAISCLLTLLLCVANPLLFPALKTGHPEEILGAALCVAAVLCALDDRPVLAGVLLGLAMANKEWAVLATGPVLVALSRSRIRTVVVAGLTAAVVVAPLLLGSSGSFAGAATAAGLTTGSIFQPWQWWWFFGSHVHPIHGVHLDPAAIYRSAPSWISRFGHTVPVAIMPTLTALYAWRHRRKPRSRQQEALLLMALLMAMRCVLDPWDISYYSLPFLFALTAWGALTVERLPAVSLLATFAAWFVFCETGASALNLAANTQALVFIAVSGAGVLAIVLRLFAPGLERLVSARLSEPVATTPQRVGAAT